MRGTQRRVMGAGLLLILVALIVSAGRRASA
jgi:hypothetical protein